MRLFKVLIITVLSILAILWVCVILVTTFDSIIVESEIESETDDISISHGTFTEYKNDTLYSITKINKGRKDSIWSFYHTNGVVESTISYDNGNLEGFKRLYSRNGKKYYQAEYKANILVSDTIYDRLLYNYKFNLYRHGKYYYRKYKSTNPDTLNVSDYRKDSMKKYLEVEKMKKFLKKSKRYKTLRYKGYRA